MHFAVLGPVQLHRQGAELDLGTRQQRLVLALLLAKAGQPAGLGEIVEVLWGQRPPSALRRVRAQTRLAPPTQHPTSRMCCSAQAILRGWQHLERKATRPQPRRPHVS